MRGMIAIASLSLVVPKSPSSPKADVIPVYISQPSDQCPILTPHVNTIVTDPKIHCLFDGELTRAVLSKTPNPHKMTLF